MAALKKRTAEARRAQSFRGYQRKIFAFSAGYQPLSAVKITFFQWTQIIASANID